MLQVQVMVLGTYLANERREDHKTCGAAVEAEGGL